jgi:hypothetical protein
LIYMCWKKGLVGGFNLRKRNSVTAGGFAMTTSLIDVC